MTYRPILNSYIELDFKARAKSRHIEQDKTHILSKILKFGVKARHIEQE